MWLDSRRSPWSTRIRRQCWRAVLPQAFILRKTLQELLVSSRKLCVYGVSLFAALLLCGCKPQTPHCHIRSGARAIQTGVSRRNSRRSLKSAYNGDSTSATIRSHSIYRRHGIRQAFTFEHNSGAFGKKYLPETMGSGVCVIDYDNDGWQDMFSSIPWTGPSTRPADPIRRSITTTTTAHSPM